jgi:hypothetical protein
MTKVACWESLSSYNAQANARFCLIPERWARYVHEAVRPGGGAFSTAKVSNRC